MVLSRVWLAVQVPARHGAARGPAVAATVLAASIVGCLLIIATVLLLDARQRRIRSRQPDDEYRTRLLMEELCPHGWKASITLYGRHAPRPADAPMADGPLVELEWSAYAADDDDADGGRVAAGRRVWERSISAAHARMLADRRLDLVLEEAEDRLLGGDEDPRG